MGRADHHSVVGQQPPHLKPTETEKEFIMSKLILKRFQCAVETDEIGADSPYFLTFVGDIATGATTMKMTRQGNWHNEVDAGEIWTVNETVSHGLGYVPNKTLVLCGVVEEDEGVDIGGAEVNAIELAVKNALNQFRATGSTTVTSKVRNDLAGAMRYAIALHLLSSAGARDDIVGVKPLALNGKTGEQPVVPVKGDGGLYRVRYAMA